MGRQVVWCHGDPHGVGFIPIAVGPTAEVASTELFSNRRDICLILFSRNSIRVGNRSIVQLIDSQGEVRRVGRAHIIADRELQVKGTVEVGGTDEGVFTGRGGDGDGTGQDAGDLVDLDRTGEHVRRDVGTGAVLVKQAGDAKRGSGDVQLGVGIGIDAAGQQVTRDHADGEGALFIERARLVGRGRDIVDLVDREGELGRGLRRISGAIQDRVGDFNWTVVVGGSREAVVTGSAHRHRACGYIGRGAVLAGVDRDRGATSGEFADRTRGIRDVGELRDRQGRRRGVGGRDAVRVDIVREDITRNRAGFVDGIGVVDARGIVARSRDRDGQICARAGGVAVAGDVSEDEFAVPMRGAGELIGTRGRVDSDVAGLDERTRLVVLALGVDREGGTKGRGFLLNTGGVEVVELLDHLGGRRSIQFEVGIDVRVVGQQVAGNQGAFFAGRFIFGSIGDVVGRRVDEVDRAGSGAERTRGRTAVAVVVHLDEQGVIDIVIGQRDVGKRRQRRIDGGLGAGEFNYRVAAFHAVGEGEAIRRLQRQRTQADGQGDGQFGAIGLFRIHVGDADPSDRLGDVFRDFVAVGSGDRRGVVDLVDREVDGVRLGEQTIREGVADLRERAVDRVEVRIEGDEHVAIRQDVDVAEAGDGSHLVRVEDA